MLIGPFQELLTGEVPYAELKSEGKIIMAIMSGILPAIRDTSHSSCSDALRSIATQCWSQEPAERPTIEHVLAELNAALPTVPVNASVTTTHVLDAASLASSMTSIEQVLEEVHPEDAKLSTKIFLKRPSSRASTGKIAQQNTYKIFKLTSLL